MADITSANAVLVLVVEDLYPQGVQLQQFATDQSFSPEPVAVAETRMGIDGVMAAGQVPNIKNVQIHLEASSPSRKPLSTLWSAMNANRKIYNCSLTAHIPSIGETIKWTNGVLQSGNVAPAAKKVLDPTNWTFHFQDVERSTDSEV